MPEDLFNVEFARSLIATMFGVLAGGVIAIIVGILVQRIATRNVRRRELTRRKALAIAIHDTISENLVLVDEIVKLSAFVLSLPKQH